LRVARRLWVGIVGSLAVGFSILGYVKTVGHKLLRVHLVLSDQSRRMLLLESRNIPVEWLNGKVVVRQVGNKIIMPSSLDGRYYSFDSAQTKEGVNITVYVPMRDDSVPSQGVYSCGNAHVLVGDSADYRSCCTDVQGDCSLIRHWR
jgi:hypothetical protein